MKKKVKTLTILLIIFAVMFCCVLAAFIVTRMTLNDEVAANQAALGEMNANKKTVYVVSTQDGSGIGRGEIVEEGVNVVKQTVYTGLEDYNYITEDDLGSAAIVDIYEGMTVMDNMVSPISIETDTREYEMQVVNLMTDQKENDVVDIRIMFPDGSDFLVLPKKQIKNLNLPNCVFYTYLNEEEILRMASATIDAYTITGTKIYAARYVESNLQEEAIPTYLVNASVADQMDSGCAFYDKNLLTKAETRNLPLPRGSSLALPLIRPKQSMVLTAGMLGAQKKMAAPIKSGRECVMEEHVVYQPYKISPFDWQVDSIRGEADKKIVTVVIGKKLTKNSKGEILKEEPVREDIYQDILLGIFTEKSVYTVKVRCGKTPGLFISFIDWYIQ